MCALAGKRLGLEEDASCEDARFLACSGQGCVLTRSKALSERTDTQRQPRNAHSKAVCRSGVRPWADEPWAAGTGGHHLGAHGGEDSMPKARGLRCGRNELWGSEEVRLLF